MIPIQLQIKNFLSYGPEPQTISFQNYHLICLSGKNGHGKSALLDAITWAIWGQARKTSGNSKADQGLLHLGQNHMFVILEFEINNHHYRIRREYVQTKSKPFTSLDFGVMQEDGKIAPLTDKTIKATQDKIEKTIGISYDAFSNSTFLRQGQSNEFSKKSPKERKSVLADILQLQQFEDQKKIALDQARKLQLNYKTQLGVQERIAQELQQLANIQELYKQADQQLKKVEQEKKNILEQQVSIQKAKTNVLQNISKVNQAQQELTKLQQQLLSAQQEINSTAQAWHNTNQKHAQLGNLQEIKKEYKDLQEQEQILQQKLEKRLTLKEQYLQTKEQLNIIIQKEEQTLEKELHSLTIELTKQEAQSSNITARQQQEETFVNQLNKKIETIQSELATFEKNSLNHKQTIEQFKQQELLLNQKHQQFQHLIAQEVILQKEIQHTVEQITQTEKTNSCFTCEQNVTESEQQKILSSLTHQQQRSEEKLSEIIQQKKDIEQKVKLLEQKVTTLKQEHELIINAVSKQEEKEKQLHQLAEQKTLHEKNIKQLTSEQQTFTKKIQKLKKSCDHLSQKKSQPLKDTKHNELQNKLKAIESEGKALNYNPEQHKQLKAKLLQHAELLQSLEQVSEEKNKQTERKTHLFALFKTAQQFTDSIQQCQHELKKSTALNIEQKRIEAQEQEITSQAKTIDQAQKELLIKKGSLEQKQKKEKELSTEIAKREKTIKFVQQDMLDYQEIGKALGKDGIQALLIEQAVPEIENEANEVLARLTNNQTQIFIESLRDLKKGGSKETLDIKISDSFGLRDYELFSGGEAFRIDFALRIGISKLLARRSGTALQTIFIDEGFGSQDEEGLQLIMENIYKVQDEFAKVIIVSHLPEMKEQFPVQFIVEKKRSGSTISVIEQG